MSKYEIGQLLVTGRDVGISIEEFDAIVDYPKGEVFEILEVIESDDEKPSYRMDFGIDNGEKDYTFDEETIDSFLQNDDEFYK